MIGRVDAASSPCIFSGGIEVVRRATTVVSAQAAPAAIATTIARQSSSACASSVIQATPAKATAMPPAAARLSRSPSRRKANRLVSGIHNWLATVTGVTSRASQ